MESTYFEFKSTNKFFAIRVQTAVNDIVMSYTVESPPVARKRADWMKPVDDKIMEKLRDEINLTPKALYDLGVASQNYAGDRCRKLANYGLVENWSSGLYRLTDEGHQYLDEQLDASELESIDLTDT